MSKVLTVIVPSYNMEAYLSRCLDSLLLDNNKREIMEVIVVNDGSKDNTSQIAHSYEKAFPGIVKVIDKDNGNYGSCVNVALNIAVGKYIKLIDADDYVSPSITGFLDFLGTIDADVVVSDAEGKREGIGETVWHRSFDLEPRKVLGILDLTRETARSIWMHFIAYRTSLLHQIDYKQSEGISYTDQEWAFYPFSHAKTLVYYPEVVYCYMMGRDGQTVAPQNHCKNMWMEALICRKIVDYYEKNKDPESSSHSFFLIRASFCVEQLYYHYILNYPHQLKNEELIEFDNFLRKKSEDIYDSTDTAIERRRVLGDIKYVHEWRIKQSRKRVIFFLFDCLVFLGGLLRKVTNRHV